jgi:hypothetical protein
VAEIITLINNFNLEKNNTILMMYVNILELCSIICPNAAMKWPPQKTSHNIIERETNPDAISMDNWIPDIGGN